MRSISVICSLPGRGKQPHPGPNLVRGWYGASTDRVRRFPDRGKGKKKDCTNSNNETLWNVMERYDILFKFLLLKNLDQFCRVG